jgi:uncharacterized surface protein with fasciclin (FAS1) repeats
MKKLLLITMVTLTSVFTYAQNTVVDVITASKEHTTLVTALKSADLVSTLKGTGPFTVLAPTNSAFKKLSPGVLDNLLKKDSHDRLVKILTYHVLAGNWSSAQIVDLINTGNGSAELKTLNGQVLIATMEGSKVKLIDAIGNVAWITASDMKSNNGVVHVVDTVLMPK